MTISQHVLRGMHALTGYNPKAQANRITADITHSLQTHLNQVDEITTTDQKELNHLIQKSQVQKR